MKSKQEISRAFRKNEARGTIRCEGRRIIAVPAPEPVDRPKSSHLMTFRTDQAFLATRDPAELERLARAKETVAEIERQQKADYREYRKSSNVMTFDPPDPEPEVARSGDSSDRNVMTSGATDLITEEERLKKYIVVVGTTAQPTTTNGCVNGHASAPAATEQNSAVLSAPDPVAEALHYWAPGSDAVAKESLCRMVREIAKDATDDEIAHSINVKGPVARSKKNPTGFLLTAVPNHFRSPALWRADLRRACGAAAEACPAPMTPAQIADVLNDPDFTESQKRQILGDDYRKPS
jgi:hypothetical protein